MIKPLTEIAPKCVTCPIATSLYSDIVVAEGRAHLAEFQLGQTAESLGLESSVRGMLIHDRSSGLARAKDATAHLTRLLDGCVGVKGLNSNLYIEACQSPSRSFRAPVVKFLRRLGLAKQAEPTCLS